MGTGILRKLSYEEQISAIAKALKEEIELLKSLPKAEAQQMAHRGLVKVGIIDEDGNYTEPYKELGETVNRSKIRSENGPDRNSERT